MSKEVLRQQIINTISQKENINKDSFVIDESFWKQIFSLYRLRLHENIGIAALQTINSISETITELNIPDSEEATPLIKELLHNEQDVFALMSELPWKTDPLSPPTEREIEFIKTMSEMPEGNFQQRRQVVKDFLTPTKEIPSV